MAKLLYNNKQLVGLGSIGEMERWRGKWLLVLKIKQKPLNKHYKAENESLQARGPHPLSINIRL